MLERSCTLRQEGAVLVTKRLMGLILEQRILKFAE